MTEKKPTLEYEPRNGTPREKWLRYILAAILAVPLFPATLLLVAAVLGQAFDGIPDRWAAVPILGELALAIGLTAYTFRAVVRSQMKTH